MIGAVFDPELSIWQTLLTHLLQLLGEAFGSANGRNRSSYHANHTLDWGNSQLSPSHYCCLGAAVRNVASPEWRNQLGCF